MGLDVLLVFLLALFCGDPLAIVAVSGVIGFALIGLAAQRLRR